MSDLPDATQSNAIGLRLKAAREARGMTLDDVAAKTRVPIRHLAHIEAGEWDALPAPTYSVGFARSYANVVGLNGTEIGAELRDQLGTSQPRTGAQAYYEPADPARVPPRSLAIAAGIIALLLAIGYMFWRSGSADDTAIEQAEIANVDAPIAPPPPAPAAPLAGPPAAAAAVATGPVVITATGDVWLRVYEARGETLFQGSMKPGDRFQVPSNARQPQIRTGRPESIRITVGSSEIPSFAPELRTLNDVSLLPADLVARAQGGAAPTTPSAATAPAAPVQQPPPR